MLMMMTLRMIGRAVDGNGGDGGGEKHDDDAGESNHDHGRAETGALAALDSVNNTATAHCQHRHHQHHHPPPP
jgi:hypothetical protein